ncbi:MAG: alkaline phosphatase family protein, partial [Planctomycetota bacterium]
MSVERRQPEGAPRRVLLVGWDAADWQMIHPLIERGMMPTLASLIERGAWGNLATLRPILSPSLWNSVATGKRAHKHGVYGFTEPDPDGAGVRTTSSTSRKCKALWNILTQAGLKTNVVGWYASHPAEPIDGVMVSNQFEVFRPAENGEITPPPKHSVHPAEWTDELAPFRVRPVEVDASAVLPFVPTAAQLFAAQQAEEESNRLGKLQQMLSQTATIHAVATHLMANTEWDLTAVYYEGIDRFGHEFMEFHPPKMEQVSKEEFDAYNQCMVGIYRFHDMMLETLLTLAGDDTAVVLISDHGYYNDHLRPDPRQGMSGPVEWHRPFGVLAAAGPGITQGARLYGASLLDVAPTVLHLLGLPAGYDMPGRVLAEVLDGEAEPRRIETWEEIDGECGMHPEDLRLDPVDAKEAMEQLVALGYVEAPSDDDRETVRKTIDHNRLSLAQSHIDGRDHPAALAVLNELGDEMASTAGVQVLKASCYLAGGDLAAARATLEPLALAEKSPPRMHMMLGTIEFAEGNPEAALEHLQKVAEA